MSRSPLERREPSGLSDDQRDALARMEESVKAGKGLTPYQRGTVRAWLSAARTEDDRTRCRAVMEAVR